MSQSSISGGSGGGGGGGSTSPAGSTGQLQFNDGSSNFDASSNLVWDDTNDRLGIGSSSPSTKLHLAATEPTIRLEDTNDSLDFDIRVDGNGFNIREASDSDAYRFVINGSTGNCGIGTSSPNTNVKLEVAGPIRSSSTSRIEADVLNNGANSANIIHRSGTNTLVGNGNYLYVTDAGNVGISTSSPSKPLHVVGEARFDGTSGAENVFINSGAADSDAYLWFMEDGTSKVAVYHDASADALVLKGDSSTDTLTVKGSNVGVGVTDFSSSGANAKLAVSNGFINVDDDYGLVFGGGTGRPAIQGSKADGEIYITNAKLGIGNSSPSQKLQITGSNDTDHQAILLNSSSDSSKAIYAVEGNTAGTLCSGTVARAAVMASTASGTALQLGTAGVIRATFDSSGNCGLGTTSPDLGAWGKALTINSDSTASSCSLELAQGGTLYGFVGVQGSGSSNALDIAAYQSQDIRFRVGASGGTHAMVIDSSGTTRATGDLIIAHDSTTTDAGNTLAFHTTTAGWATANAHATISGKRTDASNGYLTFSTRGSGTTTERMRIDSSGNFGIGTTSASSKLHLIGEGLMGNATNKLASYGILELSRAGDPYLFLRNTNSQGVGNSGFIEFYQKNGNGSEVATSRIGGSTEATHATQPSGNLKFYTASSGGSLSERMRISSDGNVSLKSGRLIIGEADVASGHIDSFENLTFNIDTDNDDTNRYFSFTYNASAGAGTEVLRIDEADGAITGGGLKLHGGILGHKDSDASSITLVGGSSSANSGANITLGGTSGSATREVIFKSNSTETMRIDADGNVAIGGSPTSSGQLDVLSANTATDITSVAGAGISLRNTSSTDNNYSFIRFDAASGNVASGISGVTTDQSPTLGELSFATTGSSGYTERIRIASTGRVTVKKSSNAEAQSITIASNAASIDLDAGNNFEVSIPSSGSTNIETSSSSGLTVGQSGVIRLAQGGGATTFSTIFKWQSGTTPTPSTSGVDLIAYYVDSSTTVSATYLTNVS